MSARVRMAWLIALAACGNPNGSLGAVTTGPVAMSGAGRAGQTSAAAGGPADAIAGVGAAGTRAAAGASGVAASAAGAPVLAAHSGGMSSAAISGSSGVVSPGVGGMASAAAGVGGLAASAGTSAAANGGVSVTHAAMPSPGCAKQTPRPQGGVVMKGDRIDSFPADYDGRKPMPLLLALHAAGNPNTQLQNLTRGSRLESDFVRVFPKSAGSAWEYKTDVTKLNAALDDVLANYCIDTGRIFGTGHSSGAQMLVQMLCNGEKRFKAAAPVAASKYCGKLPPLPVMYIQGRMDAQRGGGNGKDVVDVFATDNGCTASSQTYLAVESCSSTFDHMQVSPGCVSYHDCSEPTVWCSHNDNGYNSSDGRQHGWPCFASSAIGDFFIGLP